MGSGVNFYLRFLLLRRLSSLLFFIFIIIYYHYHHVSSFVLFMHIHLSPYIHLIFHLHLILYWLLLLIIFIIIIIHYYHLSSSFSQTVFTFVFIHQLLPSWGSTCWVGICWYSLLRLGVLPDVTRHDLCELLLTNDFLCDTKHKNLHEWII